MTIEIDVSSIDRVYKQILNEISRKLGLRVGPLELLILIYATQVAPWFRPGDVVVWAREHHGIALDNRRVHDAIKRLVERGILRPVEKNGERIRGLYILAKDISLPIETISNALEAISYIYEVPRKTTRICDGDCVVRVHAVVRDVYEFVRSVAYSYAFLRFVWGCIWSDPGVLGLSKSFVRSVWREARSFVASLNAGSVVIGCHGRYGRGGESKFDSLAPLYMCNDGQYYEIGFDIPVPRAFDFFLKVYVEKVRSSSY
jgi:hypothetical protein